MSVREEEKMCTSKAVSSQDNKKDVAQTFERMQHIVTFDSKNENDILGPRCTLLKLRNGGSYKTTVTIIRLLTSNNKDLLEKVPEGVVFGLINFFTRRVFLYETLVRYSSIKCKVVVWLESSPFHTFSNCHAKPIGLYRRWDFESEAGKGKPYQRNRKILEGMVILYFQRVRPQYKAENLTQRAQRKKRICQCWWFLCLVQVCLKLRDVIIVFTKSRSLSFFEWRKIPTWRKKQRAGRSTETVYWKKKFVMPLSGTSLNDGNLASQKTLLSSMCLSHLPTE